MNWHNKTILIVEDETANLFLLTEYLEPTGINIIEAWNGSEGIEMFIKHKPDIVLMDIKMPLMNGYEAIVKIRELDTNVTVIAQTAYTMVGDREKIMASGFTNYIGKPIKEVDLFDKIAMYIGT